VKQEVCHAWLADMDQEVGGHELVYYPSICLERPKKMMKLPNQDNY